MAAQDDPWKKFRERQEAEEQDSQKPSGSGSARSQLAQPIQGESSEKLNELIQRAETLIEQLNNLYGMFIARVEKIPPIVKRKQLGELMLTLQMTPKINPASLFKYNSVQAKYLAYCERWDRQVKGMESSKSRG